METIPAMSEKEEKLTSRHETSATPETTISSARYTGVEYTRLCRGARRHVCNKLAAGGVRSGRGWRRGLG